MCELPLMYINHLLIDRRHWDALAGVSVVVTGPELNSPTLPIAAEPAVIWAKIGISGGVNRISLKQIYISAICCRYNRARNGSVVKIGLMR